MEKNLKLLQNERANSLNAVRLNNQGRIVHRFEEVLGESPLKKEKALSSEPCSRDASKINLTETDLDDGQRYRVKLYPGINYGGKPTLYNDIYEAFPREPDFRSMSEMDD